MKRSVLAGLGLLAAFAAPASAADLPRQMGTYKAPAMISAFNWTGAYVGLHAGYGWGSSSGVALRGGFVGGQIGYNWQGMGSPWVVGVELDSAWADMGRSDTVAGGGTTVTVDSKANYVGSARVRVGHAWDRTLLYVTGGVGWVHNELRISATSGGFTAGLSDSQTHVGGTVGAGLEHALAPNWTAKFEYLYTAYNTKTYFSGIGGGVGADANSHTLKVGINYLIR